MVSHYAPPKEFDSILEEAFAARWEKLGTPWKLEREVDLVPVPGSAIIPDFRVAHPDGRSVLVEIVGFWRPEYLRKKFALLSRSGRRDIVLAVSERLNLDAAGVNLDEFADRLVWFKGKLDPAAVLERVEAIAPAPLTGGGDQKKNTRWNGDPRESRQQHQRRDDPHRPDAAPSWPEGPPNSRATYSS